MRVLLVALGAAVGAPLRFLVATWLDAALPWGTLVVNAAGSFVLGLCVAQSVDGGWFALVGVGFCGGLTTYSAFAVQSVRLAGRGRGWWRAPAYVVATVGLGLGAAALGFVIG